MTSVPIKISHQQGETRLVMENFDRWNKLVQAVKSKLIAGTIEPMKRNDDEEAEDSCLYDLQEKIQQNRLVFEREVSKPGIRNSLDSISHLVRYLWNRNVKFEDEFDLKITAKSLPRVIMNMRAFQDSSQKNFSLIDTPGANEAGALEALVKIGAEILERSCGCLFCVPFNQLQTNDCQTLFEYLNSNMYGRSVHIVITMIDAMTGNQREREDIEQRALKELKQSVRVNSTVTSVSGFFIFLSLQIQEFLAGNPQDEGLETAFENSGKMFEDYIKRFGQQNWNNMKDRSDSSSNGSVREQLSAWSEKALNDYNYYTLLGHLNKLYTDSEIWAFKVHYNNMKRIHDLWKTEFESIQDFVASGHEKQQRIRESIEKLRETYDAIYSELNTLPGKVDEEISNYFCIFKENMLAWTKTQTWTIVDKATNQRIPEYPFPGYKAELRKWMEAEGTPKFIKVMKDKMRIELDKIANELPGKISELWITAGGFLKKIKEIDQEASGGMDELTIFFERPPEVIIHTETHLSRVTTFDTEQVINSCTLETPNEIILITEQFENNIVRQFEMNAENMCKIVHEELNSELSGTLNKFRDKVESEKLSAERLLESMNDILTSKITALEMSAGAENIESMNDDFEEKLEDLRLSLYQE